MKKINQIFLLTAVVAFFAACSKEQKAADTMKGTWTITTFNDKGKEIIDPEKATQTLEFFGCDRAYTATCQGIYTVDYKDNTPDLKDTFKYNLNENFFTISKVQKAFWIRYPFRITKIEGSEFKVGNDTLTLQATKN